MNLRLGTDFEAHVAGGCLGVVDGLSTSFNIGADAVVVAGSKSVEVSEAVERNSIFGSAEAKGSGVATNLSFVDVVRRFSTKKEAIATEDSVSGEGGALQ